MRNVHRNWSYLLLAAGLLGMTLVTGCKKGGTSAGGSQLGQSVLTLKGAAS